MSTFLLPCACGQKTEVSVAQAGQSIRCACGAQLDVPTLRGLRALAGSEPVQRAAGTRPPRVWNNWHRVALLLILISACSFAAGGYMAVTLPPAAVLPTPDEIGEWFETSSHVDVRKAFEDLKKGLPTAPIAPDPIEERRKWMLWGITIALAIGALGLAAAPIVLAHSGGEKR
jgi:hypothetical protein